MFVGFAQDPGTLDETYGNGGTVVVNPTQYLEEKKNSMFKQIGNSEKPDIVAGKLLEGRVAIIVDGSPMVLTVPFIYIEDIQSSDDYYSNGMRASFVRWIRVASIFISMLTPALYIAIILHHYKAIPLKFN